MMEVNDEGEDDHEEGDVHSSTSDSIEVKRILVMNRRTKKMKRRTILKWKSLMRGMKMRRISN